MSHLSEANPEELVQVVCECGEEQAKSLLHLYSLGQLLATPPTIWEQHIARPGHSHAQRSAERLVAALELGRRLLLEQARDHPKRLAHPEDVAEMLGPLLAGQQQEGMVVAALNTKCEILGRKLLYRGSLHTTLVRVSEVLRVGILANANSLVILHNHPSGDPTPSPEDVALTRELAKAGKLVDLEILDHVVMGASPNVNVSLRTRGLM